MAFTEATSDAALVELALEFYRTPARFPGLRDPGQPLPADPAVLLRLASGASRDALGLAPTLGTAETLREAAHFFVLQVLLAPGADYYRMHGLPRHADDERIKESHRLLMRLFHPDRDVATAADWQDGFASRINQAYGVLRDAAKRREYDRGLDVGSGGDGRGRAPAARMRMRAWSERELARGTPTTPFGRYVWRHLPQFVLGGIAVLAAGMVGLIWWTNQPSGAIGSDGGELRSRDEPPPVMSAGLQPPRAASEGRVARSGSPPISQRARGGEVERVAPSGSKVEPPAEGKRSPRSEQAAGMIVGAGESVPAPLLKAEAALRSPYSVARVAEERSPMRETPPSVTRDDAAAPAVAAAAVAPVRPVEPEPTQLIPELARRYAKGDLDDFMGLFDTVARNETGDYSKIRKDYDELFAATTARQLYVWDVQWSPQGHRLWRGEGRFQARVQRQNEVAMRHYNGSFRVDVSTQAERPLIRGLYHVLADSSR